MKFVLLFLMKIQTLNILLKKYLILLFVRLGDFVLGNIYLKTIKEWNCFDKMSSEELTKIQSIRLQKTILEAKSTIPFYIDFFKNYPFSQKITDFPILTKEILREEKENLVSNQFKIKKLQKNYSSGSSGIQSYSYVEKKYKYFLQGIQTHWYMWNNYNIGDSVLQFGISPNRIFPKNIKDLVYNIQYINAFSLSNEDMVIAARKMIVNKTKFIIGYPSAINEFAKVVVENDLNYKIDGIITLGDKLFSHFIKNFNVAFINPKIIDTYGCAEGLLMACTDENNYYYIMSPHVYIEIVDDLGNLVPDGIMGNVLVTSLTNPAMPLIRYKLGDLAIKLPIEKYPKNRKYNYPMFEKIIGRETDLIYTTNGKTLTVHSFTGIVEFYPEIKQFKIIQKEKESIFFEYVLDANFIFSDSVLVEIEKKINKLTDNRLKTVFINVEKILSTPSGKPQIIESYIKNNKNES